MKVKCYKSSNIEVKCYKIGIIEVMYYKIGIIEMIMLAAAVRIIGTGLNYGDEIVRAMKRMF